VPNNLSIYLYFVVIYSFIYIIKPLILDLASVLFIIV
jgi:hypothetical protein